MPHVQVLTVAVPVLTTDSLTWSCSGEAPARQCLVTRGLLPMLSEGSARATDVDTTDEILQVGVHVCVTGVTASFQHHDPFSESFEGHDLCIQICAEPGCQDATPSTCLMSPTIGLSCPCLHPVSSCTEAFAGGPALQADRSSTQ